MKISAWILSTNSRIDTCLTFVSHSDLVIHQWKIRLGDTWILVLIQRRKYVNKYIFTSIKHHRVYMLVRNSLPVPWFCKTSIFVILEIWSLASFVFLKSRMGAAYAQEAKWKSRKPTRRATSLKWWVGFLDLGEYLETGVESMTKESDGEAWLTFELFPIHITNNMWGTRERGSSDCILSEKQSRDKKAQCYREFEK